MGRYIFLLYILLVYSQMAESTTWEYGEDLKGSTIISESTGQMTISQKTRQLPFNVPECMQVVYVKVDVDNHVSNPAIHFNEHINIVTIHYKPIDRSVCSYKATAKAIKNKNCASGKGSAEKGKKPGHNAKKRIRNKHKKTEKEIEGKKPDDNSKKRTSKKGKKYNNKSTKQPVKLIPYY